MSRTSSSSDSPSSSRSRSSSMTSATTLECSFSSDKPGPSNISPLRLPADLRSFRRISDSYPLSGPGLPVPFRNTERRRSSPGPRPPIRHRRIFNFMVNLSIPIFVLLLVHEHQVNSSRARLPHMSLESRKHTFEALDLDATMFNLTEARKIYGKERQREIWQDKLTQRRPRSRIGDMEWYLDEEVALETEVNEYWPGWWGSSAVTRSPWDYIPGPLQGEKRRVLFLTGRS
jgi:hypothetical protein